MAENPDDDWLTGATCSAEAERVSLPGQSVSLQIEIPDDAGDEPATS